MTTIEVLLDGVSIVDDILFQQAQFTALADGQTGTATLTVKNDKQQYSPTDFVMGMTLELYVDGQREWDGWLVDFKRTWPFEVMDTSDATKVPKYWKLRGFDRNLLFQKRFIFNQSDPSDMDGLPEYAGTTTDQYALLDYLANYVDLSGDGLSTSGVKSIASPGQGGVFTLAHVGAPLGLAFDDCAKMTGGVFYIDPDRVINYRGDTDVNAPFDLSDKPWAYGNAKGYADFLWTDDFTEAATDAMVWGAGYGSPYPVFARYQGDVDTYGRWQWSDLFVGAYKQATVNKRARTYVEGSPSHRRGHGEPVPSASLTMYEPGLRCGMVANVENAVTERARALPVRKLTITFPSPTSVKYDAELSLKVDAPFSAPDLWQLQDYTPPPDPPSGIPSTTVPYLIDHYDVPLTSNWESTYDIRGPVLALATMEWTEDVSVPGAGGYTKFTFTLPTDVEEGDVVLLHGVQSDGGGGIAIDGDSGSPPTYAPQSSAGWTWDSFASNFAGTGEIKGGASPNEVYVYGLVTPPTACQAMITVVKGKADSTVVPTWSVAAFDPSQSYPDLTKDGSAVIGSGWATGGILLPPDTTPLGILGAAQSSSYTYGAVVWKYLGDSYTADDIDWPVGDPGIYAPTEKWWRIADEAVWETPGPTRTGHNRFPGGNPYTTVYNADFISLVPGSSEVQFERPTYAPFGTGFALYDDYRYYLDDPEDDWGYGPVVQGEWIDPTDPPPAAPWHEPMEALFALRVATVGPYIQYFDFERRLFVADQSGPPAEMDAGGTDLKRAAFLAEYYVDIGVDSAGDMYLDVYTCWNGGVGIHPEVVPDTTSDYSIGDFDYSVYDPWDHNWYWDPFVSGLSGDEQFYLRISETDVENADTGARRLKVKLWQANQPEPDEWHVDDVLPMYKASAYKYRGYDSASGDVPSNDFTGSYSSGWIFGGRGPGNGPAGFDAWWSVERQVAYGSDEVAERPLFISTDDTSSRYQTLFPYSPGSLRLWVNGTLQTVGDYAEESPETGMIRLYTPNDQSSAMYVTYTRTSTEPNHSVTGAYRPAIVTQYGWGTLLDGFNCNMAAGCMALDRHTLGAKTSTPPLMRGYQFDQSGGTDLADLATAWANGYSEVLEHGTVSWATFLANIRNGRGAVLQGLYANLPPNKQFSDTFAGGHSLYINEELVPGVFWGSDPLTSAAVVYSEPELQAYAEGLSWVPTGYVSAGFTRVAV